MQEAQQLFNEKIANGTMTKEELENTPTCLRHFDEAEDAILKADQDIAIKTEVRSVLDSVVNQVIDLPPPLFGPRPMTIGGSSIFRDPNYDCDGNPIDHEEDYDGWDARELRTNKWNKIESEWQTHTTPREYYEVIEGYPYLPEGYVEKPKAKSKWADYEKLLKPPEGLKRHDEEENNDSWCTLM